MSCVLGDLTSLCEKTLSHGFGERSIYRWQDTSGWATFGPDDWPGTLQTNMVTWSSPPPPCLVRGFHGWSSELAILHFHVSARECTSIQTISATSSWERQREREREKRKRKSFATAKSFLRRRLFRVLRRKV